MKNSPTTLLSPRTAASLFASLVFAAVLIPTGCGEAGDGRQAIADRPAAPAISLEAAIIQGDDDAVRSHIIAGSPVNTPNARGDTPLSVAAALGRAYAAEVLVGAGAELEVKNSSGTTALFNAAFFCHPDVVRVLVDAGADTSTTDANGMTISQVMALPWEQIEPVYAGVFRAIGIPFDAERIESTRPQITALLR